MKVFISHQRADSEISVKIANRLRDVHRIDSYLDVIDNYLLMKAEDLASHIRREMATCSQLLAVVSYSTKESQWVPWEIGVATEKNFPLATFANYLSPVPEFLAAWPYLRDMGDLDEYARASIAADQTYRLKRAQSANDVIARDFGTREFYSLLRTRLNQKRY